MEFPRKLVYNPQAIDSVSFMASDKKRYFLATYLGRRYNGVVDGFIYLNIPEIGLLESLKLPDTILFQDNKEKSLRSFGAEGLHHTPLQPLKRWKISYDGKMRVRGNTKDIVHVHLDAIWTSRLPFYDVNRDTDTMLLAKIFAKEPWNDDFFGIVKDFHLTHFEQHGNITGQAVVNGEIFQLKMNSLKSRKHGILKWKHMHRYVTHFMHFQDGTSISVGMISTPVTFSSKEYGFITTANGELYPITYSSLKLHELGEAGTPPKDYSFSIKAGGRTYHIQVEVFKCAEFYAGWQWEARIVECMAKFTFNGNPGWGGVEWHYRHTGRRPLSIASMDPEKKIAGEESGAGWGPPSEAPSVQAGED
ncbi:uncharacterized protein [Hetaerina americana]|uniref:uncharacterized protein n=1 Tax=Hetaerina americana TaxID=62018 RepID=UPI003A7F48B4